MHTLDGSRSANLASNARAVCVLNVIAIVYAMNIGSNLLNDIIVTCVSPLASLPARRTSNVSDRFPRPLG